MPVFGGVEAGGTKFVCAAGTGPDNVLADRRFPCTSPAETLDRAIAFFRSLPTQQAPVAIGIGSFGPVDPDPDSPTYGYVTSTPKPGWEDTDVAGPLARALELPVAFDTDVNAAALGEFRWGAAQGLDTFIYLTIGTGIGGGALIDGQLLHGLVHPEMGHMRVPRHPDDEYEGSCPFHGDCLEGLAAGPALEGRWGQRGERLPSDHPAWELEAYYLASGLANLICTLSPKRIVLGGGVMNQRQLFPMIRSEVQARLAGYLQSAAITSQIQEYIVPAALGNRAGVLGAIALAEQRWAQLNEG
jgi:fructokinase